MAQLGDTTVIGDLSATGKVWGEGNRVYIPDYNTFDPTKLNMRVGEMVTVYNDLIDPTKSHSPWNHTSAGYLIRNNSENTTSANCTYTLMIHNSSAAAEFATRTWTLNTWQNWVIGGTGGGSSISNTQVEDYGIFYWNGKGSDTDSTNVALWQKIVNKSKTQTVMIFSSLETSAGKKAIFFINPADLTSSSTSLTLHGMLSDRANAVVGSTGSAINFTSAQATLRLSNYTVSSISVISITTTQSNFFLPTNVNSVTSYTPTYNYHPATKKYVDEKVPEKYSGEILDSNMSRTVISNYGYTFSDSSHEITAFTNLATSGAMNEAEIEINKEGAVRSSKLVIDIDNSNFSMDHPGYTYSIYAGPAGQGMEGATLIASTGDTHVEYDEGLTSTYLYINDSPKNNNSDTLSITIKRVIYKDQYFPVNNTIEYNPSSDYNPATKKYVDDKTNSLVSSQKTTKTCELPLNIT